MELILTIVIITILLGVAQTWTMTQSILRRVKNIESILERIEKKSDSDKYI